MVDVSYGLAWRASQAHMKSIEANQPHGRASVPLLGRLDVRAAGFDFDPLTDAPMRSVMLDDTNADLAHFRQSRNLHENGFRHINAKERHLRQIYKSGAEKKRAAELETREMERIERVRSP